MAIYLAVAGIALLVVSFISGLSGAVRRRPRPDPEPGTGEPWEILTQPLEQPEMIHIPAVRRWYAPAAYQRGLIAGLGVGLVIAAGAVRLTGVAAPTPSPGQLGQTPPALPAPVETQTPTPAPSAPQVSFVVGEGEAAPTIAARLKANGLIEDESAFLSRVAETGADRSLRAGTFTIPRGASLDEVIVVLTR